MLNMCREGRIEKRDYPGRRNFSGKEAVVPSRPRPIALRSAGERALERNLKTWTTCNCRRRSFLRRQLARSLGEREIFLTHARIHPSAPSPAIPSLPSFRQRRRTHTICACRAALEVGGRRTNTHFGRNFSFMTIADAAAEKGETNGEKKEERRAKAAALPAGRQSYGR